jgi:PAS domain S-box-containing protein
VGQPLQGGEEPFRLLVEQVSDYAIFLLDPAGRVVSWNTGAERLKGYSAAELIGRPLATFYPPQDREKSERLLATTRSSRVEDEGWRVRKDGSLFWANAVITPMRDSKGTLIGFAKVTRDLTDRRRAQEERVRLAEQAAAREAAEPTGQGFSQQPAPC